MSAERAAVRGLAAEVGWVAAARLVRRARRRDPAAVEAVCRRAAAPEVAAFCVAHRLAPADPADRAAFCVVTDQLDAYHAADPDGALLATGHRRLPAAARERFRAVVVARGELDLLRVALSADRPLDPGEAARLTARADRPALERLAAALPLRQAVRVAPGGLLAGAPDLDPPMVPLARVGTAGVVGVSPAGDAVAVVTREPDELRLVTYDLPGGAVTGRWSGPVSRSVSDRPGVVHTGAAVLLLVPGQGLVVDGGPAGPAGTHLVSTPDGAALSTGSGLLLVDGRGRTVRTLPLVGTPAAAGDRLAVAGRRGLTLLTADGTVLARGPGSDPPVGALDLDLVWFAGPDRLVTWGRSHRRLTAWRRDGAVLRAGAAVAESWGVSGILPGAGVLAAGRPSRLRWRRTDTLAPARAPVGWPADLPPEGPPSRGWIARPDGGGTVLHRDEPLGRLADLLDTPPTDLTPADLAFVDAIEPRTDGVRALTAFLGRVLGERFGEEIALGGPAAAGPDDIVLGEVR